jgi:hypothetical protein
VECLLDVVINGSSEKGAYGRGARGVSRQKESLNGGLSLVSTHVKRESDDMRASEQLDYLSGDQRNQRRDLVPNLGAHERTQAVAKAID